jgi:CRISPR/Cas system CMR-associated protein Cmr5 small subunit
VNRDHERAQLAHEQVEAIRGATGGDGGVKRRKAYGAACHKLPILVHQAGLAAALHHLAALRVAGGYKGKLLDHLAAQAHAAGLLTSHSRASLLQMSRSTSPAEVQRLTREIQRSLEWYKRFATMILKVESAEQDEEDERE